MGICADSEEKLWNSVKARQGSEVGNSGKLGRLHGPTGLCRPP